MEGIKREKKRGTQGGGRLESRGGGRQAGKKYSTIDLHKKECFHLNVEKLKV